MSIYLLSRGTVPMGAAVAGVLASQFSAPTAIHIMSGMAMAVILFVCVLQPQFLRLKVPLRSDNEDPAHTGRRAVSSEAG